MGIARTLARLCKQYWFPRMAQRVKEYVTSCDICQRTKGENTRPGGLLKPIAMSGIPWHDIAMDFLTIPTPEGDICLLIVVDRFSKMLHIIHLKDCTTAEAVATAFFANVARLHGLPATIITDRDPRFQSSFWKALMR